MEKLLRLVISIILLFLFSQVSHVLAQGKDEILAKVGNEVITRLDFETRLQSFPPAAQQDLKKDDVRRKMILDNMIKARLLVLEGGSRGLNERPEIKAQLRMMRDDVITQEYVRAYIENNAEISDDEAEKFYNTNPEIREREFLKVSQIVVEKEEEAKEILKRLKKGENFRKLAAEKSIDKGSKHLGGELEWFEKGKKEKEVEEALAKLEKDGMSDITKVKESYYIFRLDERKISPKPPFLKIKDEIIRQLRAKKITELAEKEIEELKKKMSIETYYEKLNPESK